MLGNVVFFVSSVDSEYQGTRERGQERSPSQTITAPLINEHWLGSLDRQVSYEDEGGKL